MKSKIIGTIITLFVGALLFFVVLGTNNFDNPNEVFQVYLNGKKIGLIKSEDSLLELIDKEQSSIKEAFNVDKVYPPNGLVIEKVYTYSDKLNDTQEIYDEIKNSEPFTVKGYTVTITYNSTKKAVDEGSDLPEVEDDRAPLKIYLLNPDLIKQSLREVASTFIGEDELKSYENGTQVEIGDTGEKITSVYFDETITIKESLISTEQKIFTDEKELTKYLLYGTLDEQEKYTVKEGEDLYKIAEDHKLNIEELLIVNPKYPSGSALLSPGEELNVGLINPLVSITYNKVEVADVEVPYKTEIVKNDNKYMDFREITTHGANGINRVTQDVKYINGEVASLKITHSEVVKDPVTEIVTKGTKSMGSYISYNSQDFATGDYSWPTLSPFKITSRFAYRWGEFHRGIDISGPGYGSPIFAVADGVVFKSGWGTREGYYVTIKHGEDLYTQYMHLTKILVSTGQHVSREQKIGTMGLTGAGVTGVHLHLGVWVGTQPYYPGSTVLDPCKSLFRC
jgi:murein DD-endopeptidase MepM/ murein hydrolase activator NlpD